MIFHGTFFKSIINRHHHQTSPVVTEYVPGKLGFGQSVCCKMFAVCWKMWHDKRNLLRWTVNSGQGSMTWLKVDSADSADQKKAYQRKSSALQWNARVSTFKPHWIWQQANNQWGSSQVKMDNTLFRLTLRHWVNFLEKADSWTQREQTYPIHSMIPQPTYSISHILHTPSVPRLGTSQSRRDSPPGNTSGKPGNAKKFPLIGFHKLFGWLLWTHEFTLLRIYYVLPILLL